MPTATELSIADRVEKLRAAMATQKLDAYVVPSPDPHQSEYVPKPWQRRTWISGFSGSAGMAVVTATKAYVWTDSRYWLQADRELAGTPYEVMHQGKPEVKSPVDWLEANLHPGARVGVDPQLFTLADWRTWTEKLDRSSAKLVAVEANLIDDIWETRPELPAEPMLALEDRWTGSPIAKKLADLRGQLARARANAHVLTTLDSIAWLFNIRGQDVSHNPVAIAYAIVAGGEATLFVDAAKVTPEITKHLGNLVKLRPYEEFAAGLDALAAKLARVWVDPKTVSHWVVDRLLQKGGSVYEKESPIVGAKAVKNAVELEGIRNCHVRDGAAVCRFFRWLELQLKEGNRVDEVWAADRLEQFRAEGENFRGLSFETIAGYAANGAIVHYRALPGTAAILKAEGIFLLDSGGQYLDGTTDITRTVALGEPSAEVKDRFTRVLQGHIALATARFPVGSTGSQLDTLARKALWDAGLNYGHGTGHGVGHFLCVHEGPAGIAPGSTAAKLEPGMVLSNEPGYYKAGHYGIRIENLVEVVTGKPGPDGDAFLGFRNLTMVPIDTKLVERSMLSPAERDWLNQYHATVREKVLPLLSAEEDRDWLNQATAAI